MARYLLKFPPVDNSPKPAGVDPKSEAARVEAAITNWARTVALALQKGTVEIVIPDASVTTIVQETVNGGGGGGSATPSGPAGGDLGGDYPDPSVQKINGEVPGDIVTHNASEFALAGSAAPPNGPAGGALSGVYPNPDTNPAYDAVFNSLVASIIEATRFNFPPEVGYPTSGAIAIDLSANNRAYIGLSGNATFSVTAMADTQLFWLDLKNTTGAPITLTWPAWSVSGGVTLPATLAASAVLSLILHVTGTTTASVFVTSAIAAANPLPTGGAKFARLLKNSTTNYDVGWYDQVTFNVADYGAVPNSSGAAAANVTAIGLAVTAMTAYGGGVIYFPQGVWYIDSAINIAPASDAVRFDVVGAGKAGTTIFQLTGGEDGINIDLSNGGSGSIANKARVADMTLRCASGVNAGVAVTIDYGSGGFDSRRNQGSGVANLIIQDDDVSPENGGWNDGVWLVNTSAAFVSSLYVFGGNNGAGDALRIQGGINPLVTDLYFQSFAQGVVIMPLDGVGGSGLCPQGVRVKGYVCVNVTDPFRTYKSSSGGTNGPDAVSLTDFVFDNGNSSNVNHTGIIIEGATPSGWFVSNGTILMNGGIDIVKIDGGTGGKMLGVVVADTGTAISGNALYLTGTANGNSFTDCSWDDLPIKIDGAAGFNRIRNIGNSTVTNSGTENFLFSYAVGGCCALAKTATQAITTATPTAISWDAASFDDTGTSRPMFSAATKLRVPYGATRVRLVANVSWESNSTGYRFVYIKKVGGSSVGSQMQLANLNSQSSVASRVMDVAAGDEFEVYAEQNSGGNLNINNTTESNFSLEIIR